MFPDAAKILSRCRGWRPRLMLVTCGAQGAHDARLPLILALEDTRSTAPSRTHGVDGGMHGMLQTAAHAHACAPRMRMPPTRTFCGPGMVLKLSATSPRLTEKHWMTPLLSPTATFWVFFSPGGSTCGRAGGCELAHSCRP